MAYVLPILAVGLTFIFTIAQLMGTIVWSWWLIFSPVLVLMGFYLFILLLIGIGIVLVILLKKDRYGRKNY